MVRLFDATFFAGSVLALLALVLAVAALTRDELPVIGVGSGALVAVAVLGMASCAVGGISQATPVGWTNPGIVAGIFVGVIALAIVGAGLAGWTGLTQPVAQLVGGQTSTMTPARAATVLLAGVVLIKWVVAVAMAALAR